MALDIGSGTTTTVESGTRTYADEVFLAGDLRLSGSLNLTAAAETAAAGSGEGTGTASAESAAESTAAGTGEGAGAFLRLDISSGTTETVAAAATDYASDVRLGGSLSLAGDLSLSDVGASATAASEPTASGVGEGAGAATATPAAQATAAGQGEGVGTASKYEIVPMTRQDTATVTYDDGEDFTLDPTPE